MGIELYYNEVSPPSRIVWLVLKTLNVPFEAKRLDLQKGEHKTPAIAAINARCKVPSLNDDGYGIGESRAIAAYLCSKFEAGKSDAERLYPTDLQARGNVDRLLYVSENVNDDVHGYMNTVEVLFRGGTSVNEKKLPELHKTLALVELYLSGNCFITDGHLTLADFFMASPLILLPVCGFDDFSAYPSIKPWLEKIKALPYFDEVNKSGIEKFFDFYKSKLAANNEES